MYVDRVQALRMHEPPPYACICRRASSWFISMYQRGWVQTVPLCNQQCSCITSKTNGWQNWEIVLCAKSRETHINVIFFPFLFVFFSPMCHMVEHFCHTFRSPVPCALFTAFVGLFLSFSLDSAFLSGVSVSPTCYFESAHPTPRTLWGLPILEWETVYIIQTIPSILAPLLHQTASPWLSPTWNSYLNVSCLVLSNDTVLFLRFFLHLFVLFFN